MQPSALTERARGLMVGIAAGNLLGVVQEDWSRTGDRRGVPGRRPGDRRGVPGRRPGDRRGVPGRRPGDRRGVPGRRPGDRRPGRRPGDRRGVHHRTASGRSPRRTRSGVDRDDRGCRRLPRRRRPGPGDHHRRGSRAGPARSGRSGAPVLGLGGDERSRNRRPDRPRSGALRWRRPAVPGRERAAWQRPRTGRHADHGSVRNGVERIACRERGSDAVRSDRGSLARRSGGAGAQQSARYRRIGTNAAAGRARY